MVQLQEPNDIVPTSPLSVNGLIQNYAPPAGAYDEFIAANGTPRAHTRGFLDSINGIGREEFARRWQQAQRTVQANDFAFGGYATPEDKLRPWELDAIPLMISAAEWDKVSAALTQRARLLNLVLQDLYGEQTLVKQGLLPPELLYAHPGFLRPYHGQLNPSRHMLHFYAADLARSPNGEWWILADRTEAPSGLGYALENRIVVSRMLPDVFHRCQVERLAPFFIAAQETLHGLAPQHTENPRVVLLSHGPTSLNYFEDSYLARYLEYTLVEGGDLAVRNDQVMLKTLGGLLPVDVILRRQNSSDCDPLELGSKSGLGIAGLRQSTRNGTVGVANALGSGLVESVAFMAFMPRLCQLLLGQELLIPGVASWWCGQPDGLAHVLKNLDKLIIQPAFRNRGKDGPTREALAKMSSTELANTIKANPVQFAAQEKVARSTVPIWRRDLNPAYLALRGYLVTDGEKYTVMQGALARTSSALDPLELSVRKGEGSKDVWILADGPVDQVTLLEEPGRAITLRRSGAELPSRTADNFFWLGRQMERAESTARLLRSAASRLSGETRSTSDVEVPVLLRCLADQGQIEPGYAINKMRGQLPAIEYDLPMAVFDSSQPSCLRSILDEVYRLGAIVRDRISLDTWRIIHNIDEDFRPAGHGTTTLSDLLAMTDELIARFAAFSGVIMESMTRTQAFHFLELGRRLERSLQIISLVKNCFIPMPEFPGPVLGTVLEVADSLMTYRARYLANRQLAAVLDLVLTDETNPRALAFQFVQLVEHVEQLPRDQTSPDYAAEQRLAMSLLHSVRLMDIQAIAEVHALGDHEPLERLTAEWESQLPKLAEAISHRYLVHAAPSHQLADISPQ